MKTTGIIFAGLDCDADAIEGWNRWYDLEHLPPNIALTDVMHGRRYVAPPSHQELRPDGCDEAFSDGRSAFLTVYWLCGDVDGVMATMTDYREVLVEADRMFPDEKKIVRLGDALALDWAVADPALKADPGDIPHISHTDIHVVLRRGLGDQHWHNAIYAPAAVAVEGVHAVVSFTSRFAPDTAIDLHMIEGDPAEVVAALRAATPSRPATTDVGMDGPFQLIEPLRYPWAEQIRGSWMPQTVA